MSLAGCFLRETLDRRDGDTVTREQVAAGKCGAALVRSLNEKWRATADEDGHSSFAVPL
jgi:hypothetical protein